MEIPNGVGNNQPQNLQSNVAAEKNSQKSAHSKFFKIIVAVLAELILLVGVFALGLNAGFHKARFTYSWSQNYSNNFGARKTLIPPPPSSQFFNDHGLDGTILTLDKNSIIIKDADNNEKTVVILPQTAIRQNYKTITIADLKTGEEIVAIGDPNSQGQFEAKLIRVLNQ